MHNIPFTMPGVLGADQSSKSAVKRTQFYVHAYMPILELPNIARTHMKGNQIGLLMVDEIEYSLKKQTTVLFHTLYRTIRLGTNINREDSVDFPSQPYTSHNVCRLQSGMQLPP